MRKKYLNIPKPILKGLANDIQTLITNDPGRLAILEMIEEMPYEIRGLILEGLSSFYSEEMVLFFHLIKDEYGEEVKAICDRALGKYSMAGLDVSKKGFFKGIFYKAYASCSRPTGKITVDIAWQKESGGLHVECFYLSYNSDGIHSFFLIPDMPYEQYNIDRELLSNMVEISEKETAFLITEAYNWNLRKLTRPAAGRYLYKKYIDLGDQLSESEKKNLFNKLSGKLTPRQIVNSFFYAVKHKDLYYINSLCSNKADNYLENNCRDLLHLNTSIIEAQAEEVFANQNTAGVTSSAIIINDNQCYYLKYRFLMVKDQGNWVIDHISLEDKEQVISHSPHNPYNVDVYCRVYEIADLDELFYSLERIDSITEVEELPYGLHLRITTEFRDDFNWGVSFLSGILADLIIDGEEFVIISRDYDISLDLHNLLFCTDNAALISRGEYQIDLVTAINYISGNYTSFEDVLIADADDLAIENNLKFISTNYLVKNRPQVLEVIKNMPNTTCAVDADCTIFYQYEYKGKDRVLLAEYVLGLDWLTLSTFGHRDMKLVRQNLEQHLYGCLEIEGMEIKENGFFDILTAEMKKDYPHLEKFLKELYLNKWYNSRLHYLGGMSPSEASETEEGNKLLWGLIKKIYQSEAVNVRRGKRSIIRPKEYISLIEEKKKEKQ